jgi:hypothetical protein
MIAGSQEKECAFCAKLSPEKDCAFCAGMQAPRIRIVLSVQYSRLLGSSGLCCYAGLQASRIIRVVLLCRNAASSDQDCASVHDFRIPGLGLCLCAELQTPIGLKNASSRNQDHAFEQDYIVQQAPRIRIVHLCRTAGSHYPTLHKACQNSPPWERKTCFPDCLVCFANYLQKEGKPQVGTPNKELNKKKQSRCNFFNSAGQ